MRQPAFLIDLTACTGCKTCMVACLDGHDLPPELPWRRVAECAGGGWTRQPDNCYGQNIFAYYMSVSCNHCQNPVCVEVCPTTAMRKGKNGIVSVDHDLCVGCRYCEWNCPYSAPRYDAAIGKMSKCDFCADRIEVGLNPLCVDACPMRAIQFGEYDDMLKKYGPIDRMAHIAPLPNPNQTNPCLFIIPPKNARPGGSREAIVINPEEM